MHTFRSSRIAIEHRASRRVRHWRIVLLGSLLTVTPCAAAGGDDLHSRQSGEWNDACTWAENWEVNDQGIEVCTGSRVPAFLQLGCVRIRSGHEVIVDGGETHCVVVEAGARLQGSLTIQGYSWGGVPCSLAGGGVLGLLVVDGGAQFYGDVELCAGYLRVNGTFDGMFVHSGGNTAQPGVRLEGGLLSGEVECERFVHEGGQLEATVYTKTLFVPDEADERTARISGTVHAEDVTLGAALEDFTGQINARSKERDDGGRVVIKARLHAMTGTLDTGTIELDKPQTGDPGTITGSDHEYDELEVMGGQIVLPFTNPEDAQVSIYGLGAAPPFNADLSYGSFENEGTLRYLHSDPLEIPGNLDPSGEVKLDTTLGEEFIDDGRAQIEVDGSARLNGKLTATPDAYCEYPLLEARTISGRFVTVTSNGARIQVVRGDAPPYKLFLSGAAEYITVLIHGQVVSAALPGSASPQAWLGTLADAIEGRVSFVRNERAAIPSLCEFRHRTVLGDWAESTGQGFTAIIASRLLYLGGIQLPPLLRFVAFDTAENLEESGRQEAVLATLAAANSIFGDLLQEIREIEAQAEPDSPTIFVDIVGHSRGGLVAALVSRKLKALESSSCIGSSVTLLDAIDSKETDFLRPLALAGSLLAPSSGPLISPLNADRSINVHAGTTWIDGWFDDPDGRLEALLDVLQFLSSEALRTIGYPLGHARDGVANWFVPETTHNSLPEVFASQSLTSADPPWTFAWTSFLGELFLYPTSNPPPCTQTLLALGPQKQPCGSSIPLLFDGSLDRAARQVTGAALLLADAPFRARMSQYVIDLLTQSDVERFPAGGVWTRSGDGATISVADGDGYALLTVGAAIRQRFDAQSTAFNEFSLEVEYELLAPGAALSVRLTGPNLAFEASADVSAPGGRRVGRWLASRTAGAQPGGVDVLELAGHDVRVYRVAAHIVEPDAGRCALRLVANPASMAAQRGQEVGLSVEVEGCPYSYHWRRNGAPLIDGSEWQGANTPTLRFVADSHTRAGTYDVVVTSDCDSVTSQIATLSVPCVLQIDSQPQPTTFTPSESARDVTLRVAASSDDGLVRYAWRKGGVPVTNTDRIVGADTDTLVIRDAEKSDEAAYDVVVSNDCAALTSVSAPLAVHIPTTPTVPLPPTSNPLIIDDRPIIEDRPITFDDTEVAPPVDGARPVVPVLSPSPACGLASTSMLVASLIGLVHARGRRP